MQSAGKAAAALRLAVAMPVASHPPTSARECFCKFALQAAPDAVRKLALELIAELVDLVGPVQPLLGSGRMLDQQQMLDGPLHGTERRLVLALALVLIFSARCARSSGTFGRVRAKRRSSFACACVQA